MGNEHMAEIGRKGGKARAIAVRQTRTWYMQQLLDIAMGKRKCTGPQLTALNKFAEMRGWYGPRHKKQLITERNLKKLASKPAVTDDLSARLLAALPKPQPVLPVVITPSTIITQDIGLTAVNA